MSIWTHVAGMIRVDSIFPKGIPSLGRTCDFDSPQSEWDLCDVPCGSEGSLFWRFENTQRGNSLSRGHFSIWGDLRSYENPDEVLAWLNTLPEILRDAGFGIRQAVVQCEVENQGAHLFHFEHSEDFKEPGKFVSLKLGAK